MATKLVFVPSFQIGHNLGNALAASGTSWVNLHLTTPAGWAERLVGAKLRANGWRPLVQDADSFFMIEAVRNLKWPAGHPLARGNAVDGLASTMLRTIRALRMAEVDPNELASADIALRGRSMVVDLFADYCTWLEKERIYDQAMLFKEAGKQDRKKAVIAILDETPLPEAAYRFVRALGDEVFRVGRSDYGVASPQHSAYTRLGRSGVFAQYDNAIAPGGKLALEGLAPPDGERVCVREAIGVENEVRGVLREHLNGGCRLDQIEIAYTSEDPYLPLLVDVADRLNLPTTVAAGIPVSLTRPGQAAIGFFRWIGRGFDPVEVVRLLRGRQLYLPETSDGKVLESPEIAQIILESRLGPGRRSWEVTLERFKKRLEEEVFDDMSSRRRAYQISKGKAVNRTMALLREMHEIVPPDDDVLVRDVARAGAAFITRYGPKQTQREQRANDSLVERLTELAEGSTAGGSLQEISSSIADLVAQHKFEAAVARPGHLYVVPLERAGYSGRIETIVVGMSEATFPGVVVEDPILLDDERARVSSSLTLQRARAGDPAWHLIRTMGMAAGRVTLTANRRSLTDGRETYPAALFEEIKEQLGMQSVPTYGLVPSAESVLTSDEAILSLRGQDGLLEDVLGNAPWLARGLEAVRQRAGAELGVYDGWLGASTPELRPDATSTVSPSRLEQLAACPHRYFLRNVLNVRPPDVAEDQPGRWLSPLEFGSLLHEVLRTFMERIASRHEKVDADRHAGEMKSILEEGIADYVEKCPVQFEAGFRADVLRLERATRVFLAEESRRSVTPVGFEVSFGMGEENFLAVAEPVTIELTPRIALRLRGSIDRVDRAADGYEVWDYKSGSTYDYNEADMLSGGRHLQWALYAYVLNELLKRAGIEGETTRSGYFFAGEREHGLRLVDHPPARRELGEMLEPLFEMIEHGAFLKVQKHKACTYCDYNAICASERQGKRDISALFEGVVAERSFHDPLKKWMEL